ncbi:MAG: transposase [Gemmatimonadaceae bacterium]|nr:transposase [Gemmatimonadaceae bacterium]
MLPDQPRRQWMLSLPHALRYLPARHPAALTLVLGVLYRTIARHVIERAGLTRASGATGAITVVQRLGSGLNLNVHFHMLFLNGAYRATGGEPPVFQPAPAPGAQDLQGLVERIAAPVCQVLERRGLSERDLEHAWLALDGEAGALDDVLGHSITYRIAVGPRAGQKLFTLQTVAPRPDGLEGAANGAAGAGRFSLHAGVDVAPRDRATLERQCRYISRSPGRWRPSAWR